MRGWLRDRWSSDWVRLVCAIACALVATALLWPKPQSPSTSWEALIAPLAPGDAVAGYRLSQPHRGNEDDVVFTARDGDRHIEIHIVDRGRWSGVRETRSFGVAYEVPRSTAPVADREAVTEAIAQAIRRNDMGFRSVNEVALASEPPRPAVSRIAQRLVGARGWLSAAAGLASLLLVSSLRWGAVWGCLLLASLGAVLRLSQLGLPFVRDQDVQRVLIGHMPVGEVLTGLGLDDRHPPLFFLILRAMRGLGQAEAVVRAPAAIAGALIGPAIVGTAYLLHKRVSPVAVVMGWVAALSPVLLERSREVSEIPLFTLVAIAVVASVARASERPTRLSLVAVASSHAISLWLYYLAPFLLLGVWLVPVVTRKSNRKALLAAAAGVAAGLPSLWIGAGTFLRDLGPRAVAERYPDKAWGDNAPLPMLWEMLSTTERALGWTLLVIAALYLIAGTRRQPALIAIAGTTATAAAIAALTPVARMQPYYFVAVAPLLILAPAIVQPPRQRSLWALAFGASATLLVMVRFPAAGALYVPSADAFMPRFVSAVLARPERTVALVAHYDATLMAYYLARASNATLDKTMMAHGDVVELPFTNRQLIPLAPSHGLDEGSGARAAAVLRGKLRETGILVLTRDALRLAEVDALVEQCELIDEAPTARLLLCRREP